MDGRLQPAFWGGLFIGVLSALPLVGAANCCCCLWILCGGALATYLRQQNTPYQVTASEGALVGLMAGAIGGVIWVVLSIPFSMMTAGFQKDLMDQVLSNPEMPPEVRDMLGRAAAGATVGAIMMLFNVVLSTVFGMLGGLLGVAVFKKNAPPPPPPPGTVEVLPPA
jgi:hypothetical protein